MPMKQNQRYGSNQDETNTTASQTRDYNTRNYTSAGSGDYTNVTSSSSYPSSGSFGGSDDRSAPRTYGSSYYKTSPSESFETDSERYSNTSEFGSGSISGTASEESYSTGTSGYGAGTATSDYRSGSTAGSYGTSSSTGGYYTGSTTGSYGAGSTTGNYGTGSSTGGSFGSASSNTSTGYSGGMGANYSTQQSGYPTGYQSSYAGQNAGNYGLTSSQAGLTGYGSVPSASQLQTQQTNNPQVNLTQAGVSNFSQQINTAYQNLQQVQRELIQTQNQIEVQAQAQIRQLQQLQQLIENAGVEVQQIEALTRMQSTTRSSYPVS